VRISTGIASELAVLLRTIVIAADVSRQVVCRPLKLEVANNFG
jgi:hypothetical protein